MVDRVELVLFDHAQQMRKLECRHALRLEQDAKAADEIENVGHMRQHVVGRHQIGGMAAADATLRAVGLAEKHDFGGMPLSIATFAILRAGSTPRTGMSRATKYCNR